MNAFNINRSFEQAKERGWDTIYWFIDAHDTIWEGNYSKELKINFYPMAKECLYFLTNCPEIKLVLWTCSHEDYIAKICEDLKRFGIHFDFVNENPECTNTELANFNDKPYYNVMLDDKAGFDGEQDWDIVWNILGAEYGF